MTTKPSARYPQIPTHNGASNERSAPPEGQTGAKKPVAGRSRRRRRGRAKPQELANEKQSEVREPEGETSPGVVDGWGAPGEWGDDWAGEYNTNDQHWGHAVGSPAITMGQEMERLASLHFELAQQIVPFWLKGIEAAEKGEPEPKLEAYWDEHIAKVKASGWFWTQSDYDRDEERRKKEAEEKKERGEEEWSNHQENEDLWNANGWAADAPGWDEVARWQSWAQVNTVTGEDNGWEQVNTKQQTKEPTKWWNRQQRTGQRNRRR